MDPYLERTTYFHQLHQGFPVLAAQQLQAQLPPHYAARIDVDVYIHEPPAERRVLMRPDVAVHDEPNPAGGASAAATTGRATAPTSSGRVVGDLDEFTLPSVHVVDADDESLVTAIELLSRTNKVEPGGRSQYLAKRHRYLSGGVNLVEVDLLRAGPRMPVDPPPRCDYLVMVNRASDPLRFDLWQVGVRDPLPVIPVPLRPGDADVELDLRPIIDALYDALRLGRRIYRHQPDPPLPPGAAGWAAAIAAEAAR